MLTFQEYFMCICGLFCIGLGCLAMRQQVRVFFTWFRSRRNDSAD